MGCALTSVVPSALTGGALHEVSLGSRLGAKCLQQREAAGALASEVLEQDQRSSIVAEDPRPRHQLSFAFRSRNALSECSTDDDASMGTDSESEVEVVSAAAKQKKAFTRARRSPPAEEPPNAKVLQRMEIRRLWAQDACRSHPPAELPRPLSEASTSRLQAKISQWHSKVTPPADVAERMLTSKVHL